MMDDVVYHFEVADFKQLSHLPQIKWENSRLKGT